MGSTKFVETTIPAIETKLKTFGGDMVRIEFIENCLKQHLVNDVKRFCHLKLSDLYALRSMYGLSIKNLDVAAECATTPKDKINFYAKEAKYAIKIGDHMFFDKAFRAAMSFANESQKEIIRNFIRKSFLEQAQEYERKNKRSHAILAYEWLIELPVISFQEKKDLMAKIGALNSSLGRIREATRYESLSQKMIEPPANQNLPKKLSFKDLGIDSL